MTSWVRNAGRIMCVGDSIVVGYYGLTGGWRAGLSAALDALGVHHTFVGPYSDAYGAHRGVSGTSAYGQTSALQTDCETYRPRVVLFAYGVNDIGGAAAGGAERSAADTLVEIEECLDWIEAGAPYAEIGVQTVIVPQTNGIPSYYSRRAEVEALNALLPAAVAARSRARQVDVGAPPTTDGVHPSDGAGYPDMVDAYVAALDAMTPGR